MKWVKCIYNGRGRVEAKITQGKIYEVLKWEYFETTTGTASIKINIITDNGKELTFFMIGAFCTWFEDVTSEVREEKLNRILK